MPNPEHQAGLLSFSTEVLSHEKVATQAKDLLARAIAGEKGVSIRHVKRFYREHAATLVPSSVDRWAKANDRDVQEERHNTLKRIFTKDVQYVQRHQEGIEKNGTIFQLTDLIKEGTDKVQKIDEVLTQRTQR